MSKTPDYDAKWGDLTPPLIENLSEDKKAEYWRNSTTRQRLREVQRLRRLKWGAAADGRMDKSRLEVVNMETGEVKVYLNNNKAS